jgi:hypothetical protein
MGIEIKLSDRELPISADFMDFLAHLLEGRPFEGQLWSDQQSEDIQTQSQSSEQLQQTANRVMQDPRGQALVGRAWGLLAALLAGDLTPLSEFQSHFHFVSIVGVPRSGGTYLTAELYEALGYDSVVIPDTVAHDGFPQLGPFGIAPAANRWAKTLQTTAEYLIMAELYFAARPRHSGKIVVPKKLCNAVYAGSFYHRVLGETAEHIVTLRHPAAACLSSYEKSGGLPPGGRFGVRSVIEEWCWRDVTSTGCREEQLATLDYFGVYLRYWEQYHHQLALTGLFASRNLRMVVYGKERLESLAREFHQRYGSSLEPGNFKVGDAVHRRHPDWIERARPVIEGVAGAWERMGLRFPIAEVMECW